MFAQVASEETARGTLPKWHHVQGGRCARACGVELCRIFTSVPGRNSPAHPCQEGRCGPLPLSKDRPLCAWFAGQNYARLGNLRWPRIVVSIPGATGIVALCCHSALFDRFVAPTRHVCANSALRLLARLRQYAYQ